MTAMSPGPLSPNSARVSWNRLIEQATEYRQTADHFLDLGLDPRLLLKYTTGTCPDYERSRVESILPRSPWAMGVVIGLVKAARTSSEIIERLVTSTELSSTLDDRDICNLIEEALGR